MKEYKDMDLHELTNTIIDTLDQLKSELIVGMKPNKAAQKRARKALLELEKSGKAYRKATVHSAELNK